MSWSSHWIELPVEGAGLMNTATRAETAKHAHYNCYNTLESLLTTTLVDATTGFDDPTHSIHA